MKYWLRILVCLGLIYLFGILGLESARPALFIIPTGLSALLLCDEEEVLS